jgi:site-2 protease. Metallo peptidase. MEROPS family M50B
LTVFEFVTNTIAILIAITLLVGIHEFGHFYVARRCGVKVLRFSIGFGRRLFGWHDKYGTEFTVSTIPLGGYVKMVDEREGEVSPEDLPYAFTQKPPWQRIAIALAGPLANLILAVLLYWLLATVQGSFSVSPVIGDVEQGSIAEFARLESGQEIVAVDGHSTPTRRALELYLISRLGETGEITFTVKYPGEALVYESQATLDNWLRSVEAPDVISGLGLSFYMPPSSLNIGHVYPGSPAAESGLKVGDRIVSIDGEVKDSGQQWSGYTAQREGQPLEVLVERQTADGDQEFLTLVVTPRKMAVPQGEKVLMGIAWKQGTWPEGMVRKHTYGPIDGFTKAVHEVGDVVSMVFLSLKKLILGEISPKNLSGPIGIAKVVAHSAEAGIWTFVNVLAYISVLLGVFNLLPIPVLDGGHILYGLIEWVKGSPVSEKIQIMGFQVGVAMLLGLTVIALYNDILRF